MCKSEVVERSTTLFAAILSPAFLNDCNIFFGALGRGMGSLFREFVIGADSFGQLSSGIPNRILSGLMYWLIVVIVMGILFSYHHLKKTHRMMW